MQQNSTLARAWRAWDVQPAIGVGSTGLILVGYSLLDSVDGFLLLWAPSHVPILRAVQVVPLLPHGLISMVVLALAHALLQQVVCTVAILEGS